MNGKIGEWMIAEGMMNYQNVQQILEFQKHGSRKKFGKIALSRHMITGKNLKSWKNTQ